MHNGIVVDANMMSDYRYEVHRRINGDAVKTIDMILTKCIIAIDSIIEEEWFNTCGKTDFKDWVADRMQERKIIKIDKAFPLSKDIKKKMHQKYGFPRSRDIHYIMVAFSSNNRFILTHDIHFYDPKMKDASEKVKTSIKSNQSGCFCIFLHKELDIQIGLCCHCMAFLRNI
jgi:hypothetical protein